MILLSAQYGKACWPMDTKTLMQVLPNMRDSAECEPTRNSVFASAANTAYLYVARSIPHLDILPADLVLEWRSALRDSLEAYRTRVHEIVQRSWAGENDAKLERLIEHIVYELDQEYGQVKRDAQSRPLGKQHGKHYPVWPELVPVLLLSS